MNKKSLFIAIEGGDGSGKGTQAKRTSNRLKAAGYKVLNVDFPQYGTVSSKIIENYLNNKYGEALGIPADLASLPFAIDRFAAKSQIEAHLQKDNAIVLANRYTASNLAAQGTKFSDLNERLDFYQRLMQIEFDILQIPKPDINFVLLVPADVAQGNVDKKSDRLYTTSKRDAHEASKDFMELTGQNYAELCRLCPKEFIAIDCMDQSQQTMRTVEDIQEELWQQISKLL